MGGWVFPPKMGFNAIKTIFISTKLDIQTCATVPSLCIHQQNLFTRPRWLRNPLLFVDL